MINFLQGFRKHGKACSFLRCVKSPIYIDLTFSASQIFEFAFILNMRTYFVSRILSTRIEFRQKARRSLKRKIKCEDNGREEVKTESSRYWAEDELVELNKMVSLGKEYY